MPYPTGVVCEGCGYKEQAGEFKELAKQVRKNGGLLDDFGNHVTFYCPNCYYKHELPTSKGRGVNG